MSNLLKAAILAMVLAGLFMGLFLMTRSSTSGIRTPEPSNSTTEAPKAEKPSKKKLAPPPAKPGNIEVQGVVKDEKDAVLPGVKVTLTLIEGSSPSITLNRLKEINTDTKGQFEFKGLQAGNYRFSARRPGSQEARIDKTLVDGVSPVQVELVLRSGLAISGYVKSSMNEPVPGAHVVAFKEQYAKNATIEDQLMLLTRYKDIQSDPGIDTKSDKEGWYQVTGLQDAAYKLTVVAKGYAPSELRFVNAGTTDANFSMDPGGTLHGVVTDTNGAPIPGAQIEVYRQESKANIVDVVLNSLMPPLTSTQTGPGGAFVLDDLGGGQEYRLETRAPSFQPREDNKIVVDVGTNLEFDITLEKGKIIKGVVLDPNGVELANARVKVNQQGGTPNARVDLHDDGVETDEQGRFVFDSLSEGKYRVVASHPDYATVALNHVETSADKDVTLQLSVGGAIAGSVTDSLSGDPIPGASVAAHDLAGDEKKCLSDKDGSYLLRGVTVGHKGDAMITVEAKGYARISNQKIHVEEGRVTDGQNFALDRNGSVSGLVVDSQGKPVAGCKVVVKRQYNPSVPVIVNSSEIGVSGQDGSFRLTSVSPGPDSFLSGSHPDFLETKSDRFELGAGENKTNFKLVMRIGGAISGSVVDESGAPIEGAWVGVKQDRLGDVGVQGLQLKSKTDDKGVYTITGLEPGKHDLLADADGYLKTDVNGIDVVEGHRTPNVNIQLLKASYIAGYVTDTSNQPIRGAKITAIDKSAGLRRESATTDSTGFYRIESLGRYPVDVDAEANGYTRQRLFDQQVNNDSINFVLEKLGSIRGRVVGPNGDPVHAFSVSPRIIMDGSPKRTVPPKTIQNDNGEFEYPGLAPGTYVVDFGAPGYSLKTIEGIVVRSDQATNMGSIVLEEGGRITGYVVDSSTGAVIPGATIRVMGAHSQMFLPMGPGFSRPRQRGRSDQFRTDRNGYFQVIGLAADSVNLRVEARGYIPQLFSNVQAGSSNVQVPLDQGGYIEGIVNQADGTPATNMQVLLSGGPRIAGGSDNHTVTDRKGFFSFNGLAPGNYQLRATNFGRKNRGKVNIRNVQPVPVSVQAGQTATVNIQLH